MTKFKTGENKPEKSGRKKGTPNKKTLLLHEIFEKAKYCPVDELLKIINSKDPKKKLTPKDLAQINLELMQYLYPKRKAIEIKQESSGTIKFVSKDELNGVLNE